MIAFVLSPSTWLRTGPSTSLRTGFTLLEVLIAIAIVALISVLGYRALAALSDSETKLAAEATRWRTLDLFFARLEGDNMPWQVVPAGIAAPAKH